MLGASCGDRSQTFPVPTWSTTAYATSKRIAAVSRRSSYPEPPFGCGPAVSPSPSRYPTPTVSCTGCLTKRDGSGAHSAFDGWQDRSPYVGSWGPLHVRHLDFRLQALPKLERGLDTDLDGVRAMLARDLVTADELHAGFAAMRPGLFRFPAVDESTLERRLNE